MKEYKITESHKTTDGTVQAKVNGQWIEYPASYTDKQLLQLLRSLSLATELEKNAPSIWRNGCEGQMYKPGSTIG